MASVMSSPSVLDPVPFLTIRNKWKPRTDHTNELIPEANGHINGHTSPITSTSSSSSERPSEISANSSASISIRAFLLGVTLGSSFLFTVYLALLPTPLWRLPFFACSLSLFHYLEYQTTAIYNPTVATVSAFLLSQNGWAYNVAHTCAFIECALRWYYYPDVHMVSQKLQSVYLGLGFALMAVGQVVRTMAMAQAGPNFNHQLQHRRKEGHVLVTDGIYRLLKHPSYFGFFWWGLGTQIVLGNGLCFVGYAVALWRFFMLRIAREETLLIGFFGMDYVRYKDKTRVGIPFIS